MKSLFPFSLVSLISILLFTASPAVFRDLAASQSNGTNLVNRGKYIVEDVAMCVQCHTPRDASGNLIREEYLNGAPVPVKAPPYPEMNWALKAPAIAGLIGYTREQGVRLLTAGVTREGRMPNPPMPPFRMSDRDAEAVVAYLKSLE
jgi:mono/diheme cytochrome c family protein